MGNAISSGIKSINESFEEWNKLTDRIIKENNYVKNINKYAKKAVKGYDDGLLTINGIKFLIPPESISISSNDRSIDIPLLRSNYSISLDTHHAELLINIRQVITDTNDVTMEKQIKTILRPILDEITYMPFCEVHNITIYRQIKNRLLENADNYNKLMFAYIGHSITPHPQTPRAIVVEFNFIFFDYLPYVDKILYAKSLNLDESGYYVGDEQTGDLRSSDIFKKFHAINHKRTGDIFNIGKHNKIYLGYYEYYPKIEEFKNADEAKASKIKDFLRILENDASTVYSNYLSENNISDAEIAIENIDEIVSSYKQKEEDSEQNKNTTTNTVNSDSLYDTSIDSLLNIVPINDDL